MKENYNIQILFNANTPNYDDADLWRSSLEENYPELENVEEKEYKYNEKSGDFHTLVSCTMPTTENINDIICLTHHAEALYECTDFENVHIEVCVDGVWHGR